MKIYFAGSIMGGTEKEEEYKNLIKFLNNFGQVLTEHIWEEQAINQTKKIFSTKKDEYVYLRDTKWIDQSDIIIAEVSIPSLGVGYELGYAESKNKEIICLYDLNSTKNLSYMLSGNKKNKIIKYKNLEEARNELGKYLKER